MTFAITTRMTIFTTIFCDPDPEKPAQAPYLALRLIAVSPTQNKNNALQGSQKKSQLFSQPGQQRPVLPFIHECRRSQRLPDGRTASTNGASILTLLAATHKL
jgi:hypothetical protein